MYLKVKGITKRYEKESVLNELFMELGEHRMLSILGRSGSGKTTLLKVIAGLEQPDAGEVWLNGQYLNDTPPNRRNIVYLYQEPLLFPHLRVFDNVAFGLRLRKAPEKAVREQTQRMLAELGLEDQEQKMPGQLSGGQRQRVAFGRALIVNPRVLLLDEPFGALDAGTREQMQQLLKRMAADHRITGLFVTHDIKEALLMGDEIAMIRDGRLKHYKDKNSFVRDADTGARRELEFWKKYIQP